MICCISGCIHRDMLMYCDIDGLVPSAWCKTAVTLLLMHWSYCSLALSHQYVVHTILAISWNSGLYTVKLQYKLVTLWQNFVSWYISPPYCIEHYTWELSWCQLCPHWWHHRLQTVTTKLASWHLSVFSEIAQQWCKWNVDHTSNSQQTLQALPLWVNYGAYSGEIDHVLTHLPLDKMATILKRTFSNTFSWMKSFVFWFKFHFKLCS